MKHSLAALVIALAVWAGMPPASAQQAPETALDDILTREIAPETLALAQQLVKLTGTSRTFDELLPNIADQAKNAFVRANPQMQLGIIEVVDRIAMTLVTRRPELDEYLARAWASGFTDEELRQLIDFYTSDIGRKYARLQPQLMAVELSAAQEWGRSVNVELTEKVAAELRSTMAAEQEALQGDTAGPAAETPAPQ